MPFNGAGVFSRLYSWVTDAVNGLPISPSRMDADSNDIAAGLTLCLTKNGQSIPTANLPMGGYKLTGLGSGSASADSVNFGQLQAYTTDLVTDSIAGLRAVLKTGVVLRVFVIGYYAAGDGGGGYYYYDASDTTSADNGGTIIVASDGGRWKLSYTEAPSVKQFGATGLDVADDAAAINTALASAATDIRITQGTYLALSPILVPVHKTIRFEAGAVLHVNHTGNGIYITGGGVAGRDFVNIIGPQFVTTSGTVPASLVCVNGVQNVLIDRPVFNDCTAAAGILNEAGYGLTIRKPVANWFTGDVIVARQSASDSPYYTYDLAIEDPDISNNTGSGIKIGGGNFSVRGGVVESCSTGGVQLSLDTMFCSGEFVGTYFEANPSYHVKSFGDNIGNIPSVKFSACRFAGATGPGNNLDFGTDANFDFDTCYAGGATGGLVFLGTGGNASVSRCLGMPQGTVPAGIIVHVKDADTLFANATATTIGELNVNAPATGGGALIAISTSVGAGNLTVSEIFHVRFGNDTNNFTATSLSRNVGGGAGATFAFSVDANGFLIVTATGAGTCSYQVIARWQ